MTLLAEIPVWIKKCGLAIRLTAWFIGVPCLCQKSGKLPRIISAVGLTITGPPSSRIPILLSKNVPSDVVHDDRTLCLNQPQCCRDAERGYDLLHFLSSGSNHMNCPFRVVVVPFSPNALRTVGVILTRCFLAIITGSVFTFCSSSFDSREALDCLVVGRAGPGRTL